MKSTRYFTVLGAALFPLVLAVATNGCDKEKEEDTVPTAAPAPTPTPTPTPAAIVPEEDAGPDADPDAGDAGDAKKVGTGGDPTGIRACCNALAGNQKSAPPDQQLAYGAAIAVCNGLVNSPQGRAALVQVRAALKGANVPSACQ
ncbi:MAG: acyltransferase [Polyangiaceae bacterium]|nr:acyltransferase [Polyangiaceae bacterium]